MSATALPQAFIWRRLHSLMGLWLVLFLMEHLLTNSQAALLLGENGKGFVHMVNALHNLPYLKVIEVVLLGVPLFIHAVWGIKYLFTAKSNVRGSDGSKPTLKYGRNRAYSWQRITSWILLIGIIGHVTKFRFIDYPETVQDNGTTYYFTRVSVDNGLYTVASRLGVTLYDSAAIEKEKAKLNERNSEKALVEVAKALEATPGDTAFDSQKAVILPSAQKYEGKMAFVRGLEKRPIRANEVIAVAKDFGTASLLTVRDTFKSPLYVGLYTIFVLAACFHAFNGFWTFLITWGVILKMSAQRAMVKFAVGLMILVAFLGLAAIWGTYFLNLKH
jgi:succinate dehydrogenase / fumarate reductase cytochrome b subunit